MPIPKNKLIRYFTPKKPHCLTRRLRGVGRGLGLLVRIVGIFPVFVFSYIFPPTTWWELVLFFILLFTSLYFALALVVNSKRLVVFLSTFAWLCIVLRVIHQLHLLNLILLAVFFLSLWYTQTQR